MGLLSQVPTVWSAPITVSIADLDSAIETMAERPDALQLLVLQRIETALADAQFNLDDGQLVFVDTAENLLADNSCLRTEVRNLSTEFRVSGESGLSLSLSSINDPIHLRLDIDLLVRSSGRAKQVIGFRLGSCQELGSDSFSFTATGRASLDLELTLELQPQLDTANQRLILQPRLAVDAALSTELLTVDVDDTLLRRALELVLEMRIDDALADADWVEAVMTLESDLKQALDNELDEGRLVVDLPAPTDEQVVKLYELLSPEGDFDLSVGYLRTQRVALLAALILGDDETLDELLSGAAQCEAAGLLQTSLLHMPLYQLTGDGCTEVQLGNDESVLQMGAVYADAVCQIQADVFATSTVDYCNDVLDSERLGNAESRIDELGRWTLSPGTRFDIGALPLQNKLQPFTQRVAYKSVETAQGVCQLEMRIHRPLPQPAPAVPVMPGTGGTETGNSAEDTAGSQSAAPRPLIAYHGGSWQRRSSGALGIESYATQFVDAGYVVFAPFYRLIDTEEGTAACNDASLTDVIEDAHDALDWVMQHAADYGAQGKPSLFGQSAGGHLAGVLSVERPDDIANAMLFYAPTDFSDFARQLIEGEIDTETGQRILETVVNQTLDTVDLDAPLIRRNTLTERIVDDAIEVPPLYLLHGLKDTVLPVNQSVRLCNALSGDLDNGPAVVERLPDGTLFLADEQGLPALSSEISCDLQGSQLHLFAEGEHALDLCISEDLCLAGSPASARAVEQSLADMLQWSKTAGLPLDDDMVASISGSGAVRFFMLLILLITVGGRQARALRA